MWSGPGGDLETVDWDWLLPAWRDLTFGQLEGATYPPIFLDYVSFTYAYGLAYSGYNLLGVTMAGPNAPPSTPHDWELQNQLFTERPPDTTRQILELDMDGMRDGPISNIGLTAVPLALDDRLASLDWDSMGEWSTYLMLLPLELSGALPEARTLSEAWAWDRVFFVRDTTTGATGTVWALVLEDTASATAMADAMRTIYGAEVPLDGYLSTADNGEPVWIEQRGTDLVVMRNVAEDLAQTVADAAFAGEPALAPRRRAPLPQVIERLRPWRRGTCQHLDASRANDPLTMSVSGFDNRVPG